MSKVNIHTSLNHTPYHWLIYIIDAVIYTREKDSTSSEFFNDLLLRSPWFKDLVPDVYTEDPFPSEFNVDTSV